MENKNKKDLRLSAEYMKNIIMKNEEENLFTFKIFLQHSEFKEKKGHEKNKENLENKEDIEKPKKGKLLKEIKLNRFFADFISPKVSKIHKTNPMINEMDIYIYVDIDVDIAILLRNDHNNNNNTVIENGNEREREKEKKRVKEIIKEIIENFFKLSYGEKIEITKENYRIIKQLSKSIGNIETYQKMKEKREFKLIKEIRKQMEEEIVKKIEKETRIERIIKDLEKKERGIIRKKKIEVASKHFYEISKEEMMKLDIETILEIISNEHLLIEDEDSLFEIIKEIHDKIESKHENKTGNEENYQKNRINIIDLYEKIEFEGLSENKFIEFIEIFDFHDLTNCLWYKLCRCFRFSTKTLRNERYHRKVKCQKIESKSLMIEPKTKDRFDGIINHLTKENGRDIVDKGIIEVVASSVNPYLSNCDPKSPIDLYDRHEYFQSDNIKDSWLCYDFKARKVCPTHYSIRSRHDGGKGNNHLQSWVIEGTNDETEYEKKAWDIIDEKKNETCLDDRNAENTFEIKGHGNKFYRYLRIRITDVETLGSYYLTLSALEYFGQIQ